MALKITSFMGAFAPLSNFYPAVVELGGVEYPTVEHAYQASKTLRISERRAIAACPTPGRAKRYGKCVQLRPGWGEEMKLVIMRELVGQKFRVHKGCKLMLLATCDAEIIEGNTWGDIFWGCVWVPGETDWIGRNELGKILMDVRRELRGGMVR